MQQKNLYLNKYFYHAFVILKLYLNDFKIKSHLHSEVYYF